MFENIIGQRHVVETLAGEVTGGRLPRAALFAGPPYSGKLSTALELARVLGCREGRGEWSCRCASCMAHKELLHPHTILLGSRYSDVEIAASADALLRAPRPATCYLFIRAVRKLTRRFDPAICDTDEPRMKSAQAKAAQVEELLRELNPEAELPEAAALADATAAIIEACAQLAEQARSDAIGVGQVRLLSAWAHVTADTRKVAILENADRMLDSARNALLKLLEEPPSGVHLLLLTTRRSALLPTVASRLRPYLFTGRTPAEESEVLSKIFRETTPGRGLRGYFLAWKQINAEALSVMGRLFLEKVLRPDPSTDILADLGDVFEARKAQKEAASSFLEEVTQGLRALLRSGSVPVTLVEKWAGWVREAASRIEQYNVSPPTAVEELFLRMRGSSAEWLSAAGSTATAAAGQPGAAAGLPGGAA